jgi:tetratricopeptide (TPR) repeat protein
MYLMKRAYEKAEICYRELLTSSDKRDRSIGRTCLALVPLHRGRFAEALEVLDHGLATDRMEQAEGRQSIMKHLCKAEIYRQRDDLESALRELELGMEVSSRIYPDHMDGYRAYYVHLLMRHGEHARAEEVARALKQDIDRQHHAKIHWYWYAIGCIRAALGDYEEALTDLDKAVERDPAFWVRFTLAETYLESGRLAEAVTEFEDMLSMFGEKRAFWGIKAAVAYYLLGLAYERSGCDSKAAEQYEEFLEIWKDADPGIAEIEDARQRLTRLESRV